MYFKDERFQKTYIPHRFIVSNHKDDGGILRICDVLFESARLGDVLTQGRIKDSLKGGSYVYM